MASTDAHHQPTGASLPAAAVRRFVAVVGSRRRDSPADQAAVFAALDRFVTRSDCVVSGGCPRGADRFAELYARERGLPIIIFHADWNRLGRRAGFARNKYIANSSDLLVACVAPNRQGGTEDTIRHFTRRVLTSPDALLTFAGLRQELPGRDLAQHLVIVT